MSPDRMTNRGESSVDLANREVEHQLLGLKVELRRVLDSELWVGELYEEGRLVDRRKGGKTGGLRPGIRGRREHGREHGGLGRIFSLFPLW